MTFLVKARYAISRGSWFEVHGKCARLWSDRSGFEPWPGTLCCVLGQDTTLTVPLSTQVYNWVPPNLMLGNDPAMDYYPI